MESRKISDNLTELNDNVKEYIQLRINLLKIEFTEKAAKLSSAIMMTLLYFIIVICVLVFISIAFIFLFRDFIGPAWVAALIVACVYIFFGFLIFLMRYRLFIDPLATLLSKIILEESDENEK
jgi:uncharacterized membrane protein YqjE